MSPAEFNWACERWVQLRRQSVRDQFVLAWNVAALAGAAVFGKLKPLHEYLGEPAPVMSPQQQQAQLDAFAQAYGLKWRPANTKIKVVRPVRHAA